MCGYLGLLSAAHPLSLTWDLASCQHANSVSQPSISMNSTLVSFSITHDAPSTLAFSLFIAQPRFVSNAGPWPLFFSVSVVLSQGRHGPSSKEMSEHILGYPKDLQRGPYRYELGGARDAKSPAMLRTDPHKKNSSLSSHHGSVVGESD